MKVYFIPSTYRHTPLPGGAKLPPHQWKNELSATAQYHDFFSGNDINMPAQILKDVLESLEDA